jgi:hypothetical protein
MMSRLEEFIKSNRKKINSFDPPEDLWEKIEKELDKKQVKPRVIKFRLLMSIAALVLVFLTSGLILYQYSQKQQMDMTVINSDLARQQVRYISLIDDKQSELKRIKNEQPELYKEFSLVMDTVEQNYQQLKNSLRNSPNPEETLKAMVLNLQVQMSVLNQQLTIIQQLNQYENEKRNETQSL